MVKRIASLSLPFFLDPSFFHPGTAALPPLLMARPFSLLCPSFALISVFHGWFIGSAATPYTLSWLQNSGGQVVGARVRDVLSGIEMDVHAKVVINATGPFTDGVRKLSNEKCVRVTQLGNCVVRGMSPFVRGMSPFLTG